MDIHTCGDEAQETVVRAYAAAQHANPQPRLRHRVHHAYFPTEATLALMAAHRIPAVVSSPFIANLGEGFVNSVGPERAARAMPMRTYLDAGVPLAGSSDTPITDFNPWVGIARRRPSDDRRRPRTRPGRSADPGRSASLLHARRRLCDGPRSRPRHDRAGKLADLVVLDRDPLAIPSEDCARSQPIATMLGGRWVFGEARD